MERNEKFVLLKNAAANVVRGGAAALVAILLPPFLTRLMPPDAFGAWSLVLQLSAFVAYLDFGIQTAVGRFVAHANEKGDEELRDRIVSTSFAALSAAGMLAIFASLGIAALVPHLFRQMPIALVGDVRVAFLLVAVSLAVGLPASVFNGIFVGLQRYEVPAAVVGCSRIISAAFLVLIVRQGGSLAQMGAAVAAVNLVSYALQYFLYRKMTQRMQFSRQLVSRAAARELYNYCLSLSIWTFAMLLVSGLDVALVGHFEFDKVAYYAVAATLTVFLAGIQNAVFNVMIPSTAVLQARGNSTQLGQIMITATRYGSFILLLMGLPLILAAKSILTIWVGPTYATQGARILQVLTIANIIRLSAVPYVMTLIGTGQQRLVTVTPLLEGGSNLIVSVIGGYLFGAVGVAVGTLVGAVVGVSGNFFYNMRRTVEVKFAIADYFRDGLIRPVVCALPLTAAAFVFRVSGFAVGAGNYVLVGFVIVSTAFLLWHWGLVASERDKVRSWYALTVEA
jgi:O-antigen/teichoic acid export membrane protein